MKMTIADVKEILTGNFENENDRMYWVEKLHQLEIKEQTKKGNQRYFKEMAVYNR